MVVRVRGRVLAFHQAAVQVHIACGGGRTRLRWNRPSGGKVQFHSQGNPSTMSPQGRTFPRAPWPLVLYINIMFMFNYDWE